jgi:hypothetical protein
MPIVETDDERWPASGPAYLDDLTTLVVLPDHGPVHNEPVANCRMHLDPSLSPEPVTAIATWKEEKPHPLKRVGQPIPKRYAADMPSVGSGRPPTPDSTESRIMRP